MAKVDWSQFTPVEPEKAAVDWSQFTPVAEAPKAEPSFFDKIGNELGQLRDEFFSGVTNVSAGMSTLNTTAAANQLLKKQEELAALEAAGKGATPEAESTRKWVSAYASRMPTMVKTMSDEVKLANAASQMTTRDAVKKVGQAKSFGEAWSTFTEAPYDVIAGVTAQSLPAVLPALLATAATRNVVAGSAIMGTNSAMQEIGGSISEYASDNGVDPADQEALSKFLADPVKLREAMDYAGKRGVIIGAMDAASGGLASKTLAPKILTNAIAKQAVNLPSQMAAQAAFGAGGEAGAQLATKGEVDQPGQVLMEAVGELGGAPAEVLAFAQEAATANQPPAPTPPANTTPKVEEQSTVPTAPVVQPKAAQAVDNIAKILAPAAGDPIAPTDDNELLARVPVEGADAQTPKVDTGAAPAAAAPANQPAGDGGTGQADGQPAVSVPNAAQPEAVSATNAATNATVSQTGSVPGVAQTQYDTLVQEWNTSVAAFKVATPEQQTSLRPQMDALASRLETARQAMVTESASQFAAQQAEAKQQRQAQANEKFGAMGVGTRIGISEFAGKPNIYWEKTGDDQWTRFGVGSAQPTKTSAEMENGPVLQAAPTTTLSPAAQALQQRMALVQNPANGQNTGTSSTGVAPQAGANPLSAPAGGNAPVLGEAAPGGSQPSAGTLALGNKPAARQGGIDSLPLAEAASEEVLGKARQAVYKAKGVIIKRSARPLNYQQQVVAKLGRMMGKTVTFIERASATGEMPNGFVNHFAGEHIFLDVESSHPVLEVLMHEGTHALPAPIRNKLKKVVLQMVSQQGKDAFLKEYGYTKDNDFTKDEEVTAFVTQLVAKNPRFFQDLRKALGNRDFAELAKVIISKIKSWFNNTSDFDAEFLDKYVSDVQAVHDAAVQAYADAMREMGMEPDAEVTGPAFATKAKSVEDKDGEPDDSRETIEQADIPESVDAPATLESALKLAGSKVWNKGRDLKVAMQEAVQTAARAAGVDVGAPSEATTKYLARVGTKDALSALKQNANAVGWYDLKTRQALSVMSLVHPELARDENARFAMVWAMAVTSNGLKVGKNFEIAEKVYREYKRTGEMPPGMGIGNAAKAIDQSLALFNELKEAWGIDNLRKFMLTNFTVKEITGIQKDLKPGGEHADVVVKGAAILGPKIGNGFFSNLYGNFDALTMDRWLIRTWGRWTGTLISPMAKQTAKAKERLEANLAEILKDPTEVSRLSEALGKQIAADMSVDDLAMAVQKASMEPATRKVMNATGTGEELRKAGNGLAKYLDGQKEAPAGPTERKYIRKVFGQILSELRKSPEYKDLSMADLQAVLWYAEKRLYESAKEDPSDEEVAGYSDDDAPDYANAASDVARAAGVSDRKIQNALKREEQYGRTGTTRSGDEQAEPDRFGLAPATGSFADQERRDFIAWQAFKRISANRRLGGSELSWAYEGKSTGDGGRVRVLKKLGVSYVAEWTLGQKAKNVLKANDLFAAKLYELAPGDINNAQKFADAITASKNSAKAGAAVYVYPVQSNADETGYADMRLFLVENGKSGVAVKRNGDIVSVFGEKGAGVAHSLMQVALAAGGRKLDAFDTILPRLYSLHGFRAVARTKWNDDFAPEGWNKDTFDAFNGGEPDVVFMAYDPQHGELYQADDGKTYDDYDKAVAAQTRAVNKVAKDVPRSGPVFSNKADGAYNGLGGPNNANPTGRPGTTARGLPGSGRTVEPDVEGGSGARPYAVRVQGTHFSQQPRTNLDGRYNGTGLKGAERTRLSLSQDPRIKERVYFYVDEGNGIRPESGVGGVAHTADLRNIYDVTGDKAGLFKSGNDNLNESAVLDAGYNGYYVPKVFNNQGVVVVLGNASRGIKVTQAEYTKGTAPAAPAQPYKRGLSSKELNTIDMAAVQEAAPSAKLRAGTFSVDEAELDAAREVLSGQGIDLPAAGPVFSNKAQPNLDQDIVLEIPVEGGKTAKLTINAQVYINQLDAREDALRMVKECML